MRNRAFLLAAIAALIPALEGCGGNEGDEGAGDGILAEAFATEADALCTSFNKEHPAPPEAESAKQAANFAQHEADLRVELQEQLVDIGPPEEVQADFDTYSEQTTQIVEVIEGQVTAADEGDPEAYSAAFAEIDTLTAERTQTAETLGFKACGQAAGPR